MQPTPKQHLQAHLHLNVLLLQPSYIMKFHYLSDQQSIFWAFSPTTYNIYSMKDPQMIAGACQLCGKRNKITIIKQNLLECGFNKSSSLLAAADALWLYKVISPQFSSGMFIIMESVCY